VWPINIYAKVEKNLTHPSNVQCSTGTVAKLNDMQVVTTNVPISNLDHNAANKRMHMHTNPLLQCNGRTLIEQRLSLPGQARDNSQSECFQDADVSSLKASVAAT
jgi:hypothetical protein